MRWLFVSSLLTASMLAQNPNIPTQQVTTAPSGSCNGSKVNYKTVTGLLYTCQSGTWAQVGGSAVPSGVAAGDLSGTYPNPTVAKINGTALSGLATGLLKNTTATGVPSIAVAGTDLIGGVGNLTTVGSVPYVSASGILNQDAGQLHWDATNNRLGIGTATPVSKLDITDTLNVTGPVLSIRNTNVNAPHPQFNMDFYGYAGTPAAMFSALSIEPAYAGAGGSSVLFNVKLQPQSTAVTAMTILGGGNVGIGTATPVSKLDITDTSNANLPIVSIRNTNGYSPQLNFDTYGYSGTPAAMFSMLNLRADYAGAAGAYVSFNVKLQPQSTAVTAMTILGGGNVGIGTTAPGSLLSVNGRASANLFGSETNCSSSAGPAVCAAAAAGSVIIPAAGTDVTVNTTAVTANSQIFAIFDQSLGTKLGVTCNSTTANPHIGARVAGTSFTIHANVPPVTNPACFSYFIIN